MGCGQAKGTAAMQTLAVNSPSYLTRKEAAGLLRVSLRTLDNYINSRRIPFCRLGGRTLFRRAAIEEHLAKLEVSAGA
jgi:excisionase family DNA binding protein